MSLQDVILDIRSTELPRSERAIQHQVIPRILAQLGWDRDNPKQVAFEYEVVNRRTKQTEWVDIALLDDTMGKSQPVSFLEIKAPSRDLKVGMGQLEDYAYRKGVKLVALANGKEFWFYYVDTVGDFEDRRVAVVNIFEDDIDSIVGTLSTYLGKHNLLKGQSERFARQEAERILREREIVRILPTVWHDMCSSPNASLVQLVIEEAKNYRITPTEEHVTQVLQGQPIVGVSPTPSPVRRPPKIDRLRPAASDEILALRSSRDASQVLHSIPISFELLGQSHTAVKWNEVLIGVSRILAQRHPDMFEVTLKELDTPTRPFASHNQDTHTRSALIGDTGLHIEINKSAPDICKTAYRMIKEFHYDETELVIYYRHR